MMTTIKLITPILFLLLLFGCTEDFLKPNETVYIQDEIFEKGVTIKGHKYDNLIIENCTFTKRELNISEVDNVIIRNCKFKDINNDGIRIGVWGSVNRIVVENSIFTNIGFNGIYGSEYSPNCVIRNCSFNSVSLSEIGAAMGQPYHSIYWTGKNVLIEGNFFENGNQKAAGDLISVRSSGILRGNTIRNAISNGIMYFTDRSGGDTLLIENNILYNNTYGINLQSNGSYKNHNSNVIVRFNTIVQDKNYSIRVDDKFETTTNVEVYGNILINPTGEYLKTFYTINQHHNLTSMADIGFVNMKTGELHITTGSSARNFCSGLVIFPSTDIDNETRNSINLDAGADEIN